MNEQKCTKLIIVHQIVRVEFSEVVEVPADFSHDETTRLVSDFWNITDRNKVVTTAELMEPGGQYIERVAPEDNTSGTYKPDLSVTRSPEGELIYRRLSDDAPVTAD
ncbi:TPA: hypothetical protein ACJVS1_001335 [Salmonella enterica subsp. enterica serovar Montevideo]